MSDYAKTKIALVTGSNRGIGKEIARQLSQEGVHVITAARTLKAAESTAEEIPQECTPLELDVSDEASRLAALQFVTKEFGRLDILINNAGIALDQWVPTLEVNLDLVRDTMEVNLYGPLALCQLFIPLMQKNDYGRVVNLSSELASMEKNEMGNTFAYRSSKAALNMLTVLLAKELKDNSNILINAAAPGWVRTEMGGPDALRSVEEGADTPIWLATLPEGGPSGGFFRDRAPYAW